MLVNGIIAVFILLIVVFTKAKESEGLPSAFSKLIIGRPHGVLVRTKFLTLAPTESTRRLVAIRALAACAIAAFVCFMTALLFTGSAESAFTFAQSSVGLWCIFAAALCSQKLLGLLWGLFYALLGGTILGAFAALPFIATMAATQHILPTDAISSVLFICFSLGVSGGIYLAPTHCIVHRMFEDGHTDLHRVSSYSSAYRKLSSLANDSEDKGYSLPYRGPQQSIIARFWARLPRYQSKL